MAKYGHPLPEGRLPGVRESDLRLPEQEATSNSCRGSYSGRVPNPGRESDAELTKSRETSIAPT